MFSVVLLYGPVAKPTPVQYNYILENTLFQISTGSLVLKLLCTGGQFLSWSCPIHVYFSKSMDQPSKVNNPARGQLNRENEYFPAPPVRAWEFGLARRPFVYLKPPYAIGSVPSLSSHAIIAYRWRSLPGVRRQWTPSVRNNTSR